MTITIEVPTDIAEGAAGADLTAADLNSFALAGMAAGVQAARALRGQERVEVLAALHESAEDVAAGRVTPLEQVIAEAHERRHG
jgi:hypothetical protein